MTEIYMWILIHLGIPLAALIVIVAWIVLIFVIIDEARGLMQNRKTPPNTQDGEF